MAHLFVVCVFLAVALALNVIELLMITDLRNALASLLTDAGYDSSGVVTSWGYSFVLANIVATGLFLIMTPLMGLWRYKRDKWYVVLSKEEEKEEKQALKLWRARSKSMRGKPGNLASLAATLETEDIGEDLFLAEAEEAFKAVEGSAPFPQVALDLSL